MVKYKLKYYGEENFVCTFAANFRLFSIENVCKSNFDVKKQNEKYIDILISIEWMCKLQNNNGFSCTFAIVVHELRSG